ncbi:MAG TPA: hypothetical protein PK529_02870 [Verrucomicrobiales bacterium]|nr:hypothetical protein [Verrucomicrobiales bacterium]
MAKEPEPSSPESGTILVNKLSVADAVHMVRNEGGPLSPGRAAFRVITVLVIAAFTARAIILGHATAWHLFLPMVGEYLVLLLALPIINLILNDPTLRKDARRSVPWQIGFVVLPCLWIVYAAHAGGHTWGAQASIEMSRLLRWITSHEMHWPIIGASAAILMSLPGRIAAFHRHGPPFVAVGIGCAMRFIVALLGCFLLPIVMSNPAGIVWAIWAILLLSELGAVYMHWDLQKRLRKKGVDL